jgi:alanyl aminopeptidase
MATHFANHPQREVADAALTLINRMDALIEPADRPAYAALWQRAFGERGRTLGLLEKPSDSTDDRLMRANWVGRLADVGQDASLQSAASQLAKNWLTDRNSVPANSRGLVLRTAALTGKHPLFDALLAAVASNPDRRERADIYAALANFSDPELDQAARQLWLSPAHNIREVMAAGRSRRRSNADRDEMLAFIRSHFEAIAAKLTQETSTHLPKVFSASCTQRQAEEMESFFTPLLPRFDGMAKTLAQSLEAVRLCASYRDAQQASLHGFLTQSHPGN